MVWIYYVALSVANLDANNVWIWLIQILIYLYVISFREIIKLCFFINALRYFGVPYRLLMILPFIFVVLSYIFVVLPYIFVVLSFMFVVVSFIFSAQQDQYPPRYTHPYASSGTSHVYQNPQARVLTPIQSRHVISNQQNNNGRISNYSHTSSPSQSSYDYQTNDRLLQLSSSNSHLSQPYSSTLKDSQSSSSNSRIFQSHSNILRLPQYPSSNPGVLEPSLSRPDIPQTSSSELQDSQLLYSSPQRSQPTTSRVQISKLSSSIPQESTEASTTFTPSLSQHRDAHQSDINEQESDYDTHIRSNYDGQSANKLLIQSPNNRPRMSTELSQIFGPIPPYCSMNLHLNDILADNSQNILGCAAKIWPTSTATTEYQPNRMMDSGIWSINNTFTDFHYIKWGDMIAHSSYQTSAECHTNLANTGFQGANSTNTNRQTTSERATRLQSQQPTNESTSRLQHTSSVKSTPLETMPTGNGTSNRIISESQSNSSFNTISLLTLTTKTKSQDLRSESVESQPIDIIDTWIGSTREVGTEIQSSKEINTGFQLTNSIRAKILPMCINTVDTTFQSVDTTSQPVDTTSQSVGMHDVDTESLLSPEADNEDPSKSKVDTELSPLNSGNIEIRSTGTIDTKVRPTSGIYEAIWSSADIDTGLQATRPIDTEIPITKVINSKPQTTIDTEALPTPKSINKPRSIDPTKTEIQSTNIIDAKSQLICKTGDKAQSTKKMPLHNPRPEIDGIDFHSAVMEKSDKRYQYDKNIITKSDSASAVYSVAGEFKCYTCKWKGRKYDNPHGWGSKKIAVEIWMSDCRQYQTQIHSQKCSKCMLFVEPSIQVDDYAVKVANVLNGRKGRHSTANAPQRNSSSGEHKSELCNFCMKGKKH